jgi:hypothetical protein
MQIPKALVRYPPQGTGSAVDAGVEDVGRDPMSPVADLHGDRRLDRIELQRIDLGHG